jgi:hypothetical protein
MRQAACWVVVAGGVLFLLECKPSQNCGDTLVCNVDTVVDKATNLTWERSPSLSYFGTSSAAAHCASAAGWRLSSLSEIDGMQSAANGNAFPNLRDKSGCHLDSAPGCPCGFCDHVHYVFSPAFNGDSTINLDSFGVDNIWAGRAWCVCPGTSCPPPPASNACTPNCAGEPDAASVDVGLDAGPEAGDAETGAGDSAAGG